MAHRDDRFIFSDNIEDWMSSPEKRAENNKRFKTYHKKQKEKSGNNNSGYKTLSSMNDQLRAG